MNDVRADFVEERDRILEYKPGESAIELAEELVRLMELLAIHGSTGIDGDPALRSFQVDRLAGRIGPAT